MSETIDIFKTTIFKTKINKISYKNFFINKLNNLKKNNQSVTKTNIGGFQSEEFTNIDNKEILENVFLNPAIEFTNSLIPKKKINLSLSNFWINSNNKNDYNLIHNHHGCNISGVFYIKTPPLSGRLVFKNGDLTKSYGNNFDFFYNSNFNSIYFCNVEEGDLYLFTSETLHYVEPNRSGEERISVAFNLNIS
jgi:uncharacterized protein (TIGR02466 family)